MKNRNQIISNFEKNLESFKIINSLSHPVMHEVSVAYGICEIIENERAKANAFRISKVEIDVGTLSGIETEALLFAWDIVTKNTPAEEAPLVINSIKAMATCLDCGKTFETQDYFSPCTECGSFKTNIIQGKEMQVKSITVEDGQ